MKQLHYSATYTASRFFLSLHFSLHVWLVSISRFDEFLNVFAGIDEFTLLPALHSLQHAATELTGPTAAASAESELSKSENPLQWLKRP